MAWDVMNRRNDFTKPRDKYSKLTTTSTKLIMTVFQNFLNRTDRTSQLRKAKPIAFMFALLRLLSATWAGRISLSGERHCSKLNVFRNLGHVWNPEIFIWMWILWHWLLYRWLEIETIPKGYSMTFLKAISDTTGYMIAILLVPRWLLKLTPLRKAGIAHSQLEKYLRKMIQTEQKRIAKNENDESSIAKGNLLTEVLKASASNNLSDDKSIRPGERKDAFTEDEVMGNLFIYLLAGILILLSSRFPRTLPAAISVCR